MPPKPPATASMLIFCLPLLLLLPFQYLYPDRFTRPSGPTSSSFLNVKRDLPPGDIIRVWRPPIPTESRTATFQFLPNRTQPVLAYSAAEFATIAISLSPSCMPTVHSLQLRKCNAWFWDYRHEFLVLGIRFEGQEYFLHLNRAWIGDSEEKSPPIAQGGHGPANDSASLYFPGRLEKEQRDRTTLVAEIILGDAPLRRIGSQVKRLVKGAGPYSLFGMNCWAWSRFLTLAIADTSNFVVRSVNIPGRGGQVDPHALVAYLSLNQWFKWARSVIHNGDRPSVFQRLLDWLTGVDSPLSSRWLTLTMSYKDEDDSQCLSQTYEIDINRESTPLCIPDAQLSMWLVALPMNIPSERRISTISLKTRDDNQHSNGNHSLTRVEVAVIRAHPRGGTDHFRVVRQFAEIPDDNFRSEHDLFVNQTILQRRQEGDQLVMWWTGAECWVDPPLPPDFPGQWVQQWRQVPQFAN